MKKTIFVFLKYRNNLLVGFTNVSNVWSRCERNPKFSCWIFNMMDAFLSLTSYIISDVSDFYRQLNVSSQPGYANGFCEKEAENCLVFVVMFPISSLKQCFLRKSKSEAGQLLYRIVPFWPKSQAEQPSYLLKLCIL